LRHTSSHGGIHTYINAHKISKLLITITRFIMDHIDAEGFRVSVGQFTSQLSQLEKELLHSLAQIQGKTVIQLTDEETY
jgi:hypothetical protein